MGDKILPRIEYIGNNKYALTDIYGETKVLHEVVQCKDCKYWNKIGHAMYCTKHISIMYMDTDDFCSRGELK